MNGTAVQFKCQSIQSIQNQPIPNMYRRGGQKAIRVLVSGLLLTVSIQLHQVRHKSDGAGQAEPVKMPKRP